MKLASYIVEFKHPTTIDKPKMNMRRVRVVTNKRTLGVSRLEMSIYTMYDLDRLKLPHAAIHELVLTAIYEYVTHLLLPNGTITFFSPFMEYSRAIYNKDAADLADELITRL
jgi:hypothetical protein